MAGDAETSRIFEIAGSMDAWSVGCLSVLCRCGRVGSSLER